MRKAILNSATVMAVAILTISAVQAGPLQVGAARLDITSYGYPDGNVPPTEYEHERLYARAIVLDNGDTRAVLIGVDMGGVGNTWQEAAEQISQLVGAPVENIIMSGTHTHAGPPDRDIVTAETFPQVVRMAMASMQPATVGFGEGAVYLNVNRDVVSDETHLWTQAANLDGPSDKTLAVLAFYDEQGTPIAGYMNYAMHPVNSYLSGYYTGDFAGAASRHVEQAFNDDMVMIFTQGASGDQNPLHLRTGTNLMASAYGAEVTGFELTREPVEAPLREGRVQRGEQNPVTVRDNNEWMQAQGMVIGEEAIRVMTHMDRLANEVELAADQTILTCPGRVRTSQGREGVPGTYQDGPDKQILLRFLGINEIALGVIPGEAYSLIGQQVKEASPLARTMVVTIAPGIESTGYIPTDDAYGRQTFQVLGSRLKPGCAQSGIVNGINDMIYEYVR